MTEDDARAWVADRVDRVEMDRLDRFVTLVIDENSQQNLIAPGTIPVIWHRHVVDSLQLLDLVGDRAGTWLDIGSGGGFPGMVLALAGVRRMMMVEPRKRRVAFLQSCIDEFALDDAAVLETKVENVDIIADVITARAVASVEKLLRAARQCCTRDTRWLLPRGSAPLGDLTTTARGMMFHVEQSLTEAGSSILVLDGCPR